MDFDSSMKISASGLSANRAWINVISSNLANINTTRTGNGKPYERRTVIYEATPFEQDLDQEMGGVGENIQKVQVADIVSDGRDFKEVYDPSHPDANAQGIVMMPNISPVEEMASMVNASKSYEANLAALNTAKQLAMKAIDIAR